VFRKLLTVTVPACLVGVLLLAAGAEVWVRWRWDPRRGTPGLFLADPVRQQRLAPDYRGWFAGVPILINNLGLRADRDYAIEKAPNTFRILVLGDSVTFGHGSLYEHTYPRLFEERLKAWKPSVDWQVWNAGVPGYNTSQELATLLELGPRFQPDLVIVGFFPNDVVDNVAIHPPGWRDRAVSVAKAFAQRHLRSVELYRRIYLTLAFKISASDGYKRLLEHLPSEEEYLANPGRVEALKEQQLTDVVALSDAEVAASRCVYGQKPNPELVHQLQADPGWDAWIAAVRELQSLNRSGAFRLAFFINMAPNICQDGDRFYDGGAGMLNQYFLDELSQGTPAVSSYDAFLHHRPSQMPVAQGHSLGNSNRLKADILFDFFRAQLSPGIPALAGGVRDRQPSR
jgi:hypothetical protein